VPVRIELIDEQITEYPLPVGSSLHVRVDTSERDGQRLSRVPDAKPVDVSPVYAYWREGTKEMADEIIAQHLPRQDSGESSQTVTKSP